MPPVTDVNVMIKLYIIFYYFIYIALPFLLTSAFAGLDEFTP